MKIFLLPYAGGSASIYYKWKNFFEEKSPALECIPIELAGRGRKFKEDLYQDFEEAIEKLSLEIIRHIENNDSFSIFGHSLGSYLAFEVARRLETTNGNGPKWLFVSGSNPPHLINTKAESSLPDSQFLEHVKKLGGTAPSFFESKELVELYTPILKSDFHLLETYSIDPYTPPYVNANIMAFGGEQDLLSTHVQIWGDYTKGNFNHLTLPGDHFFLNPWYKEIIQAITGQITNDKNSLTV
ncbi:thioesterase domain-containing protein [Rossellomorea oryzaecorticis]|uniref:Thioesterase domain-containing protein n=1 Tax=Rossellomorea oryzaecorticis TaxID=1396505 RepID=A0ABU9K4M3_9BACI